MIALLTTYLIVAYVLIPGVLFRLPASLFVQLRLFQLTKTQEVTFGCFVSVIPFLLALICVWHAPVARNHPFSISESDLASYKQDYRNVLTLIIAKDPSSLLVPKAENYTADATTNERRGPYAESLHNFEHRQLRFLFWYYVLIAFEGVGFGYATRKYGDWSRRYRLYDLLARKILLPRLSEFQLLLTDFTFPKKPKRDVFADVLCDTNLYRGKIGDYFINGSGELSGVLLKEVSRFRRTDYQSACGKAQGSPVNREEFWRAIPGANFYIPANKISNINLRFPIESTADLTIDLEKSLKEILKNTDLTTTISIESPAVPTDKPDATAGSLGADNPA